MAEHERAVFAAEMHAVYYPGEGWTIDHSLCQRVLLANDSADEIINAGIDGVVAVFITGSDRIWFAFELGIETGFAGVEKRLFVRRKRSLELEGINQLFGEMGGAAESLHISALSEPDRLGFVVAGRGGVGLQSADFGDVAVVIAEDFAALDKSAACTDDFLNVRGVFDSCHISI